MENKKQKRQEFITKIGPTLKDILTKQKKNVDDVTYGCVKTSDYEAGEMIAKKVLENNLV